MGMSNKYISGFTIIEVMLFLAISGALAIGILATSGAAINTQRYRDALNSFQSLIQHQYNETANVVNTREDSQACGSDASATNRGASNCYIVGRVMVISGGKTIAISNVRGEISSEKEQGLKSAANDLAALNEYTYRADTSTTEASELAWGTSVSDAPATITILILRSPLSGTIRTFSYDAKLFEALTTDGQGKMESELDGAPILSDTYMKERTLCVDRSGLVNSPPLGVVIKVGASGASGIELTSDNGVCNATS